ncbi:putative Beta-N-acetylhexosaminidase [Rhodotorula taiwanensis]|uniref:Beta-hexosaminidase n=1 Tax=Rhodotorula taiwanensis TaxID=741276 RepID=A0A2S5BEY7_9BASI|nr:putative Beta-N-acetylhexosaminidase [Rhodotorula taiwanensis]
MRWAVHLISTSLLTARAAALWPKPQRWERGSGFVRLAEGFRITSSLNQEPPDDLVNAIERTLKRIEHDWHQPLQVGRAEPDRLSVEAAPVLGTLQISLVDEAEVHSIAFETTRPYAQQNEAYKLTVSQDGVAELRANTTLGLLRGLETFSQLVFTLPESAEGRRDHIFYLRKVPMSIEDWPALPHRGFMLDTARNFYPVDAIDRNLQAMSYAKLNVFHWHVVDSQAWPLESATFPDLARYGAYSQDETYSASDVRHVVRYAASLGISVMLELDMPGHTASIASSFSDYIACHNQRPWSAYAAEPPAGQIKLGHSDAREFAKRLMHEAALMSSSPLLSSGGDEVNQRCYLEDPDTSAALEARNVSLDDLLGEFVEGVHSAIRKQGKTPVVWEEMVLNHELGLDADVVVMVWISSANVRAVADKGHTIVHAASDYFYLDCGAGAWLGNTPNGRSWCDPFKSWQKAYSFDPYHNLTKAQHRLVLGGETLLWSEQAGPENLDSIAWPRAAAAAEVFWTGGSLAEGRRRLQEALPRLHDWRYRAVARGIQAIPLQPHWCALRPGACDADEDPL